MVRNLPMFRFLLCLWLPLLCLPLATAANENRIWLEAKINNQPVRLIFDTGCDTAMLFQSTAQRLGLKVTDPPLEAKAGRGQVLAGYTDICELKLWNQNIPTRFNVVDLPSVAQSEVEGLIGWPPLRSNIIAFDAKNRRMSVLGRLPSKTEAWQKFPIRKNAGVLILELPRPGGGSDSVMIDTGSAEIVSVSPRIWKKWKQDHPDAPFTLTAYYMPGSGMVIAQVMWASTLNLGPIELHNVLIREANVTETAGVGSTFMANLPLEALDRKDLIVDGKGGFAYLSTKNNPPDAPVYNRLGAVFVPEPPESDDLVAHVARNSPAEKAGIRNGDILLKIGSRDVTNWRNEPKPKTIFTEQPEGTRLELVLKRAGEDYTTTAVLEDILRPKTDKPRPWERALRWIREHQPQF